MFDKIIELIENHQFSQVRTLFAEMNIVDIAEIFESLNETDAVRVFRLLPKETAAEAFSYMSADAQKHIVVGITDHELSGIIHELFIDDAVDFIEEMPANVVKRVLSNANPQTRALINRFLQYKEDSAGSLMTIEFVDLKKEMTVAEAFQRIRRIGPDKETIYTCYVMSPSRKLEGIVTVKDLLLSDQDAHVGDIMDTNVIYVSTDDDREDIANIFQKYNFLSLPVVDRECRLVGIITIDDAVDVLQQENTEDFEIMAAVTPSETPYLKTHVSSHAKNRVLWLLLLMLFASLSGAIVTSFQNAFAVMPILVSFIPMLMNTGGNCGSQASTLIIRGLALGEIHVKDFLKVWWKEIRVALLVGLVLSIVGIFYTYLVYGQDLRLSIAVSLSLFATILIAKSIGGLLPIGAEKLHLDPALMASPIITSLVDICALYIYFTVAKVVLHL